MGEADNSREYLLSLGYEQLKSKPDTFVLRRSYYDNDANKWRKHRAGPGESEIASTVQIQKDGTMKVINGNFPGYRRIERRR